MVQKILIVDDDPAQRRLLESVVGTQGHVTETAQDGRAALDYLRGPKGADVDLVLLDLVMPGMNGMAVLAEIKPERPGLPVIVLTAHGSVTTVVEAMRAGANDFIVKPASPERLQVSIENCLKLNRLSGEVERLKRRASNTLGFTDLIARSLPMRQVLKLAERAAKSSIPVLIDGESGVGKEVIARAIQGSSDRAGKPFVTVNCGAIPENLVESILFGHEKGAFTGATDRHTGKFEEANGGTLFLDEIGELRLDMQVKLLRALQESEIDRVGGTKPIKVDVRIISATNRDLAQLVTEGKFREDLYYRLNVFPLTIPPLRERAEDIPDLIEHFISRFSVEEGKKVRGITPEAMEMLTAFRWPGNVRQLENAVFRAVVLSEGAMLGVDDFPQIASAQRTSVPSGTAESSGEGPVAERVVTVRPSDTVMAVDNEGHVRQLDQVEADMIDYAIRRYGGHMSEVARRLGIGRSTLYRKVRDYGLESRESA
ncbi:MAG: sigma-54 dependent transcriptional regulator [Alphaproteobacteria bacterium]|nr:sigma-54 dependent transcriptional regulator [Alphaproteobacteria bacterium]MDX5370373.1 sigma-54 dependent transcriptional regulator [Alphaproteobacteria bacterium]MDX5464888.1 sigma-54 dependent transcriptional regulator [Alphaproteobacteria bacterium]